ncbi:MAG: SapC family protein [Gammaproteobacteria bacterium]|nr:SapC family protein [Gammaproteobacteria bacterium]
MSKLVPISQKTHAGLRWSRPTSFRFTASDHLMPLGMKEMQKAAMGLPAGFIKLEDKYLLIAIQGLCNGENLVIEDSGNWLAAHLPDAYQGWPFRMARIDKDRYQVCIQEESELVCDAEDVPAEAKGWRRFFDEEGNLEPMLADLVNKMRQHAADLVAAERATAKLAELELIKEWEITAGEEESPVQVRGLYTVDQERLAQLDGESLAAMRDCGALYLTYVQLLSGHHMPALVEIARRRWKKTEERELDFGEIDETGNISFDNL